jgi:hypothetical protein
MNKGIIRELVCVVFMAAPLAALPAGEIYKVVDKDGNVTFTDQRPSEAAEPLDLPPLSVIETDVPPPATEPQAVTSEEVTKVPTTRELRRQFADFRITQPQAEETFWGTANSVVVAWGSSQPIPSDLSVRLFIDGKPQDVTGNGSLTLTLDRGEHQVYAELLDSRKRPVVTTATVVFFVKQASVGFNHAVANPFSVGG